MVANDGGKHDVQINFETTPEWAVNKVSQEVQVTKGEIGNISFVKAETTEQPRLQKKGDNMRIDRRYVYLAANKNENCSVEIVNYFTSKEAFIQSGTLAFEENELIQVILHQEKVYQTKTVYKFRLAL